MSLQVKKAGTFQPVGGGEAQPWYASLSGVPVDSSGYTPVSADATAHTKGEWSEVIASTAADASALVLRVYNLGASGTNTATLLDIGTGAAGSETVVVPDVNVGGAQSYGQGYWNGLVFCVPLNVPAGTRIVARTQSTIGSDQTRIFAYLYDFGPHELSPTAVDCLYADTSESKGTQLTGASNTWVEVTASTSVDYAALVIVPSLNTTSSANTTNTFAVGTGAAGSEIEVGGLVASTLSNEGFGTVSAYEHNPLGVFAVDVPAGTRVAVRTNASDPSDYAVTVLGIPAA